MMCRRTVLFTQASVPSLIIVRLPRLPKGEHKCAGRDSLFKGFPSGGAEAGFCQKWVDRIQANDYWSGTEYSLNPNNAWNFNFNNGDQNNDNKDNNNYALAVRPGR